MDICLLSGKVLSLNKYLFGVEHIRAQRSYFAFEFAFLDGKFIAVNAVGVSAVG